MREALETALPVIEPPPPDHPANLLNIHDDDFWNPILNPTQQKAYEEVAKYVLTYGEKGSGKSFSGIHSLIRHCYEEEDALALIIAPQIRTGKEGVIYDLTWALDVWQNGNKNKNGERIDSGMGLEYTEPALDPQTKDRVIFIGNQHGGWSKVILISIPYAEVVEKRMKALSPSFVYVDEITELESREYFTYVSAQLGRRRGIRGPQQYFASCNPTGPSHWVYLVWFIEPVDEEGRRDKDFAIFHVPIHENKKNLPDGYIEGLIKIFKDPIDQRRLLNGEWIDRPSGDSVFKNYFKIEIHVRPTIGSPEHRKGMGLVPHTGFPIFCGYDPGPNNYCVTWLQMIPTRDGKIVWIVFDELILVAQHRPDFYVAARVMEKISYWKTKTNNSCQFIHVSDASALTHLRHDGSYDATRMKTLTNGVINFRGCPQAKESVPARVSMVRTMFLSDTLFISSTCPKTVDSVNLLCSEKQKEGKYDDMAGLKPKRSVYLHPFDSMSYPIFYTQLMPSAFVPQVATKAVGVFRAGRG